MRVSILTILTHLCLTLPVTIAPSAWAWGLITYDMLNDMVSLSKPPSSTSPLNDLGQLHPPSAGHMGAGGNNDGSVTDEAEEGFGPMEEPQKEEEEQEEWDEGYANYMEDDDEEFEDQEIDLEEVIPEGEELDMDLDLSERSPSNKHANDPEGPIWELDPALKQWEADRIKKGGAIVPRDGAIEHEPISHEEMEEIMEMMTRHYEEKMARIKKREEEEREVKRRWWKRGLVKVVRGWGVGALAGE
ncbi:MAG: hypothetical protein M1834_004866 [Cirrosporium novae-zelandiae]|nr:MAG: hypothetical protein M1834_004866 [Cirrosporium novae-zelandiae]